LGRTLRFWARECEVRGRCGQGQGWPVNASETREAPGADSFMSSSKTFASDEYNGIMEETVITGVGELRDSAVACSSRGGSIVAGIIVTLEEAQELDTEHGG